jgi:hypothetical protein
MFPVSFEQRGSRSAIQIRLSEVELRSTCAFQDPAAFQGWKQPTAVTAFIRGMESMELMESEQPEARCISAAASLKDRKQAESVFSTPNFGSWPAGTRFGRRGRFSVRAILHRALLFTLLSNAAAVSAFAQPLQAPAAQPGNISGTVTDAEGDVIADATVTLQTPAGQGLFVVKANDYGGFAFNNVPAGGPYRVHIAAPGCVPWTSPEFSLQPGQFLTVNKIAVQISGGTTSIVVKPEETPVQLATEQVKQEEKQRVLGVIPNFYVSYDPHAAPMTTKLKYKLALRTSIDPVTVFGSVFLAAVQQAGDTPNYQQGWDGYAQRFGADYTDGFTDVMLGGAILPSLLHQDPRYFYQGTGGVRSRLFHALMSPFFCRGDNGKREFNYSSIGGDLGSGAISNLYYPQSSRGLSVTISNTLITTAGRMVTATAQEFLFKKVTTHSGSGN